MKFKVGDRVRVLSTDSSVSYVKAMVGTESEIIEISNFEAPFRVKSNTSVYGGWWFWGHELELINNDESKSFFDTLKELTDGKVAYRISDNQRMIKFEGRYYWDIPRLSLEDRQVTCCDQNQKSRFYIEDGLPYYRAEFAVKVNIGGETKDCRIHVDNGDKVFVIMEVPRDKISLTRRK